MSLSGVLGTSSAEASRYSRVSLEGSISMWITPLAVLQRGADDLADVDAGDVDRLAEAGDHRGGGGERPVDRVEALERVGQPLLEQDVEAAGGAEDHQRHQDQRTSARSGGSGCAMRPVVIAGLRTRPGRLRAPARSQRRPHLGHGQPWRRRAWSRGADPGPRRWPTGWGSPGWCTARRAGSRRWSGRPTHCGRAPPSGAAAGRRGGEHLPRPRRLPIAPSSPPP